jgi:hypothetical protein
VTASSRAADYTGTRAVVLWSCLSGCWTVRAVAACDWRTRLSCGQQTLGSYGIYCGARPADAVAMW